MSPYESRERRSAPRRKMFRSVTMVRCSEPEQVHVLNISTGGALVYSRTTPEVGELVELDAGLGRARVTWRDGRLFGVTFASALSAFEVETLIRTEQERWRVAQQRLAAAGYP